MTDSDFTRILEAVSGYWPRYTFTTAARKAWRHMLANHSIGDSLEVLSVYAAEGHPYPPVAGQLVKRIADLASESAAPKSREESWRMMLEEMATKGDHRVTAALERQGERYLATTKPNPQEPQNKPTREGMNQ